MSGTAINTKKFTNDETKPFIVKEYPINLKDGGISMNFYELKKPEDVYIVMKIISRQSKINFHNGSCIKIFKDIDETIVKFQPFYKSTSNKIYIEVNRLQGDAFLAQIEYVKWKLKIFDLIVCQGQKLEDVQEELNLVKRRYALWIGKETTDDDDSKTDNDLKDDKNQKDDKTDPDLLC